MEYQARIGSDQPIGPVDRLNKNPSLVDKMKVLAGAMNQIADKKPERKRIPQKKPFIPDGPEEQRILIDELPKILFLNNKEPKKVINNFRNSTEIFVLSIICNSGQPISTLNHKN